MGTIRKYAVAAALATVLVMGGLAVTVPPSAFAQARASLTNGAVVTIRSILSGTLTGAAGTSISFPTVTATSQFVCTSGSISASTPCHDDTQTWNNAGVTFTGWKLNVTDSNSAAASLLTDLQVGTVSKFKVDKTGGGTFAAFAKIGAASFLEFSGLSVFRSPSNGVVTLSNNAETDFTRLQFGGTTSSFPSLKRVGSTIQFRLADDSATAGMSANDASLVSLSMIGTRLISSTAPTISSGFGSSPSIPNNNGTAAFTVNVGTGGVATSGVIGLPTATTGWNCFATDRTTNVVTRQTATTTTTATLTAASAWTASDILSVSCFAY